MSADLSELFGIDLTHRAAATEEPQAAQEDLLILSVVVRPKDNVRVAQAVGYYDESVSRELEQELSALLVADSCAIPMANNVRMTHDREAGIVQVWYDFKAKPLPKRVVLRNTH